MLAFLVLAIITPSIIFFLFSVKQGNSVRQVNYRLASFPRAVEEIYQAYREIVFPLGGLSGVNSSYLAYAVPFPVAFGRGIVGVAVYSQTPADVKDALRQRVSGALFKVGCTYLRAEDSGARTIFKYYCDNPKFEELNYHLSDGTEASSLSDLSLSSLSPLAFPVEVEAVYLWKKGDGSYAENRRTVGFEELYAELKEDSAEKINSIARALRTYFLTRLTTEMELRPYPNGLHSVSDHYVPWFWQILADSGRQFDYCVDDSCSNFNLSVWKNSASFQFVLERLRDNLFDGEWKLLVDPFGRPYRIILVGNGCSGDLTGCGADNGKPPKPTDDYYSVYGIKPPFFTWIVSDSDECLSDPDAPVWCRFRASYEN